MMMPTYYKLSDQDLLELEDTCMSRMMADELKLGPPLGI